MGVQADAEPRRDGVTAAFRSKTRRLLPLPRPCRPRAPHSWARRPSWSLILHGEWTSHKGARRLRSAPAPRAPVHTDSAAQSVTLRGRQRRHRSARNQLMRKPLREAKASARGTPGALYRPPDARDPLAAQSTLLILRTAEFPHRKTERPPFEEHPPEPRPDPDTGHRPHNHSRSPTQKPSHPTLPRVSNRPK